MENPDHLDWLVDTGEHVLTACGLEIKILELRPTCDNAILSSWAYHFRQHYISDTDLPKMADGTGWSKADFLKKLLFPDAAISPGPSVRSGDFGEILVTDYIEYMLGYWCPRVRYRGRLNKNAPTKGCDVIGFKIFNDGQTSSNDEMFVIESKSATTKTTKNRLQNAIDDSIKDKIRIAMSLNAIKHRFLNCGTIAEVKRVQRFQNEADQPFRWISGAAAILDNDVFAQINLKNSNASNHWNAENLKLLVIRGPSLMKLIHTLYERAADEA